MGTFGKIGEKITHAFEYGARGFHAVPEPNANPIRMLPSQHRLLNVVGMVVGFSAMKYLGDIAYGQKINGGEYKEIKREDVPKPLRFMHGIIHNNPFSDAPREQWLKVLHQMLPAAGGAVGAIHGSNVFFKSRGAEDVEKLLKQETLTPLDAEKALTFMQGKMWGVGSGLTAWVGSVTGLTGPGYGGTLNPAFLLRNLSKSFAGFPEIVKDITGGNFSAIRDFTNTQSALGIGPVKAMKEMNRWTEALIKDVHETGNVQAAIDKLGEKAGRSIVVPFIRKATPEQKERVVAQVRHLVEQAYKPGVDPAQMHAEMQKGIEKLLMEMKLGEFKGIFKEGDNGWLGAIEKLNPKPFEEVRSRVAGAAPKAAGDTKVSSNIVGKTLGIATGAGILGYGAKKIHDINPGQADAAPAISPASLLEMGHTTPAIAPGMSAEQYVAEAHKMHVGKERHGVLNGGLLGLAQWMGDAALAVVPKNRFFCSLGLTAGGGLGLYAGKLLAGRELGGANPEIAADKFPALLRPLHGVLKFDPASSSMPNRWKKLGALYAFTAISAIGIMVGAKHAYKSAYKANENPDSLEDYMARVGQHQGDKWRFLAATSGVLGSTSGFYALPFVPGLNYGSSVAFYTVLNQDRKIMTPGLRAATGTKTTSYLGLREGLEYLTKYAEYNPSKNPAELEYLTLTVLGPIAHATGKELTATQIKSFVDKIHSVRDKYWQPGGIPKDRREAMHLEMDETFKNQGLDKTLYECGIDTKKIDFLKINGLIGKLGNKLGAKDKILKDQEAYRTMVDGWRSNWQQQAAGEEAAQAQGIAQGQSFSDRHRPQPKPITPQMPPLSYQERVLIDAANDAKSIIRAD